MSSIRGFLVPTDAKVSVTWWLKASSAGSSSPVGFGTFSVTKRKARMGRNPQTGEPIKISARKVARFKAGKELEKKIK